MEGVTLGDKIKEFKLKFLEKIKGKELMIISHFDTDGISSAAIMIKTLTKLDQQFSLQIQTRIERGFIESLPKDKPILFLDLASGSLNEIRDAKLQYVFIIDHHEIIHDIPENVEIINPQLHKKEEVSSSSLCYLFAKEIDKSNKELSKLAILGMIGDCLEKNISKLNNEILNDGDIKTKRGPLLFPSTRPLNRTLEYSSSPFIPGVTGDSKGALEMLREAGFRPTKKGYPSLLELSDEEMARLTTAIMLRNPKTKNDSLVGNIYLIKLFGQLEDARELSGKINACSRFGQPHTAIQLCMEVENSKKKAESIHVKYRQTLVTGLRFVEKMEKIIGDGYVIINAQDNVKDTMIGTICSILSYSSIYNEGTIIVGMSNYEDKIKVSARRVGSEGRNVRDILNTATMGIGGEVGGHAGAGGCTIFKEDESKFIESLKKHLEPELVKA